MFVSFFELFKIGIGPSSSHTVGPMVASDQFLREVERDVPLSTITHIEVDLFGSLALTGKGHGTDTAILLGLMGKSPATVDIDTIPSLLDDVHIHKKISLLGQHDISFDALKDIHFFKMKRKPLHPNGMTFHAFATDTLVASQTFYSIGGGLIQTEAQLEASRNGDHPPEAPVPYPFSSAKEMILHAKTHHQSIATIEFKNEASRRSETDIIAYITQIWKVMQDSVSRGCHTDGILPGGLNVKRRAPELWKYLQTSDQQNPASVMDWISLYAMAVNEENAAGGRVVTAPTNGASGIIPAVLHYYEKYVAPLTQEALIEFFLTASAIGSLYKKNASISGAEMGCQGEVGVAASMAAAGLTALSGGTPDQVESAAEIAMEHHLGLTCDPIKGLVQVPCIERNTMGAIKAVNASRLAISHTNSGIVSLDKVIKVMKQTGEDMKQKYKETSTGGLASNVVEC